MNRSTVLSGCFLGLSSLFAPASAFELGSCLILHVSESSSPKMDKVSIAVDAKIFRKEAKPKATATATASDFIQEEKSDVFEIEDAQSTSDFSTVGDSTFSLDDSDSAFSVSPFESSSFKFD